MKFILNTSVPLFIALLAGLLTNFYSSAAAEPRAAILPDDFNCIFENLQEYRDQGDFITLNFETCPEPPTFRERMEARDAKAFFPPLNPQPDAGGAEQPSDTQVPEPMASIEVTRKEFDCLMTQKEEIKLDSSTGRLLILPDSCQNLSQ